MTAGQAPAPGPRPGHQPDPAAGEQRPAPAGSGELAAEEPGQPAFRGEFDAELRRDAAYESGLAGKMLIALAVVAVLITIRLLGF